VSPAGALDLMVVEEEGGPAGVMAAAKRGRWQAALQLAMGHPQVGHTGGVCWEVERGVQAPDLQKERYLFWVVRAGAACGSRVQACNTRCGTWDHVYTGQACLHALVCCSEVTCTQLFVSTPDAAQP
jgi:hypothetical protein